MTLLEIAEKIIEEKGGDEFREAWLRKYLSDPDNLSEFLGDLLKKQLANSAKQAPKNVPKKIGI